MRNDYTKIVKYFTMYAARPLAARYTKNRTYVLKTRSAADYAKTLKNRTYVLNFKVGCSGHL